MTTDLENDAGSPAVHASIVIPAHDRCDDLRGLLRSLDPATLAGRGVEVLVFDDGSTDGTADVLRDEFPDVRVVSAEGRRGPAYARNAASHAARGRLLLYLDSDGEVSAGWLDAMLAGHDGETVLLGCVVDFDGGRVQSVPRRATFLGKSVRARPEKANTGPSCNLGVPRSCFDALGGFDEEIPYYFEDSDLCIRARKAGFKFQYLPKAVFRHKGTERKTGDAIRMQEHNSTYAMLKAYRRRPFALAAFLLLNTGWLCVRILAWGLRGRVGDSVRLMRGWWSAHLRFLTTPRHSREDGDSSPVNED